MQKKTLSYSGMFLIIAGLLGGCEVPQSNVTQMPDKPYILQHTEKILSLYFSSHQKKLSSDEKDRFLSELKPLRAGKCSTHVTLPRTGSSLGKQRLKEIIRAALKSGIKPKQIHKSEDLPSARGNSIEVILDTYCAIPPLCPNWQTQYGSAYERGNTSNFGCSTAHNFLLMIDDPIILFKGEKETNQDALPDSLIIANHRAGKDRGKWLKIEKVDNGSSGSSGSSSGSSDASSGGSSGSAPGGSSGSVGSY